MCRVWLMPLSRLQHKCCVHAIREPPCQHLTAVLVHALRRLTAIAVRPKDCYQIQKPPPHWNICDIGTPNLIWPIDHDITEQIGPYLVLRVLLTSARLLIDLNQSFQADQATYTVAVALMVVSLHVPGHFTRPIPRRLQKLFIDDLHK